MPLNKRTPLYQQHVNHEGKIIDFCGWDMPVNYGSQIQEHNSVRESTGIFDVSHMTVIDVSGEDAREYLRYILANDVAKLDKVGEHIVQLQSCAFKDDEGNILDDWDGITELQIQSADKALPNVLDFEPWNGSALKLLALEWKGGILHARPKPYPVD